jgi:hypothetical protein
MPRLHFRTGILNSSKWRRTLAHPSCYETKGERKQRQKSLFYLECLGQKSVLRFQYSVPLQYVFEAYIK